MGDPLTDEQDPSVREHAETEEAVEPPEPPMDGDVQLSFGGLGGVIENRNARKIEEAVIVLQGGEPAIDGLLSADREYALLVRVLPDMPKPVAIRDTATNKVKAVKMRQTVQTKHVKRADNADAIRDLFADLLARDGEAAGALLDELREFTTADFQAAA